MFKNRFGKFSKITVLKEIKKRTLWIERGFCLSQNIKITEARIFLRKKRFQKTRKFSKKKTQIELCKSNAIVKN